MFFILQFFYFCFQKHPSALATFDGSSVASGCTDVSIYIVYQVRKEYLIGFYLFFLFKFNLLLIWKILVMVFSSIYPSSCFISLGKDQVNKLILFIYWENRYEKTESHYFQNFRSCSEWKWSNCRCTWRRWNGIKI
jgi:hypothetical protein